MHDPRIIEAPHEPYQSSSSSFSSSYSSSNTFDFALVLVLVLLLDLSHSNLAPAFGLRGIPRFRTPIPGRDSP